jgi:hypothetical protein
LTGQKREVPGQSSSTSQAPNARRHTVVAGWKLSAGQAGSLPVHNSQLSQPPPWPKRHTTVDGSKASLGQLALLPLHVSATSQVSLAARHSVPAGSNSHAEEQQSPGTVLPSSHCSVPSWIPLPHTWARASAGAENSAASNKPSEQ